MIRYYKTFENKFIEVMVDVFRVKTRWHHLKQKEITKLRSS